MKKLLAQVNLDTLDPGINIWRPTNEPLQQAENVISIVISALTVFASLYFIFLFIIAAYSYMTGAGDKQKIVNAQQKIIHALIGLVIVIGAYAIISLIGYIMGYSILKPSELLGDIWQPGS